MQSKVIYFLLVLFIIEYIFLNALLVMVKGRL